MEQFIYVFIHLGVPPLLLMDFLIRKSNNRIGLLLKTVLYISIFLFLFLWGQWPLVGSYYLRYVMIAIIITCLFLSVKRFQTIKKWKSPTFIGLIKTVATGLLSILVLYMTFSAINGLSYPEEGVSLEFPLKNGTYYIASGGSNKIINNHMRDYPNAQEFALDINKLGTWGAASKKILSNTITDHYIFSDTVYCPCNGKVIDLKSSVKDNESGSMTVDSNDGTGNYINIHCDKNIYVFIPHLKQNSIFVSKNAQVISGMPLGLVGISGFSQEPHLHMQAAKYNSDSILIGVPMIFNDQKFYRNDLYKVQ